MSLYEGILDFEDTEAKPTTSAGSGAASTLKGGQETKSSISNYLNSSTGNWNTSGLKLLQSQMQLKRAAQPQVKPKPGQFSHIHHASSPTTDADKKPQSRNMLGKPVIAKAASITGSIPLDEFAPLSFIPKSALLPDDAIGNRGKLIFGELEVEDEYNPLYPNVYEKVKEQKERERAIRKAEEKRKEVENSLNFHGPTKRHNDDENEDDSSERERAKRSTGAAIAPPQALIAMDSSNLDVHMPMPPPPSPSVKGLAVAAKIMEKYGYRQGSGLGKSEQGISTALQVEKTGLREGKIIKEDTNTTQSITEILRNPTKIILLRNMVGPNEVDADLEPEVREECTKYGDVVGSKVLMLSETNDPEEIVRIFIEFAKIEHAVKAVVDLNGRYFAGRMVKASFYELDKYRRFELAD